MKRGKLIFAVISLIAAILIAIHVATDGVVPVEQLIVYWVAVSLKSCIDLLGEMIDEQDII